MTSPAPLKQTCNLHYLLVYFLLCERHVLNNPVRYQAGPGPGKITPWLTHQLLC
eukprot:jgi/Botrbrau1/16191/Bobra.0342s0008.1